ncbi:MAG: SEC-C metal-binding domain-containing protein, partial [Oscillospiraceae bacterium]
LGFLTKEDDFQFDTEQLSLLEKSELVDTLKERALEIYNKREEEFTPEVMRELERVVMLKIVDTKWMDHIDAMEELKRGIYLRSYAQKDPAVEFRFEGFEMFDEMINSIREDTVRLLLTIHISPEHLPQREQVAKPLETRHGDGSEPARKEPVKKAAEPGPNDPCPCGSGKKYKKCCGNSTAE